MLLPELKMATAPASQPASPRANERVQDAPAAVLGPWSLGLISGRRPGAERPPPAGAANQRVGPAGRGCPRTGCVRTRSRSLSA